MSNERVEQILDYAEAEMRKGGVDAVSFRTIADAIGIKSASVHYHFPTKTDLCRAVVLRYTEKFQTMLGAPDVPDHSVRDRLDTIASGYAEAYRRENSACLCTVLGAMANHLPDEVADPVQDFFDQMNAWLQTAMSEGGANISPEMVVTILQGAMTLATSKKDMQPLIEARDYLLSCTE